MRCRLCLQISSTVLQWVARGENIKIGSKTCDSSCAEVIMLESSWGRLGVVLGLHWGCRVVVVGSFCDRLGVILGSFLAYVGSLRGHFGVTCVTQSILKTTGSVPDYFDEYHGNRPR